MILLILFLHMVHSELKHVLYNVDFFFLSKLIVCTIFLEIT